VTWTWPDEAVEVSASPVAVGGAGTAAHEGAYAAGGNLDVLAQDVGRLIVISDSEAVQ
jgi:hypothetical protein